MVGVEVMAVLIGGISCLELGVRVREPCPVGSYTYYC